jgi:hypothetical protein
MEDAGLGFVFRWYDYRYRKPELEEDFHPVPIVEITPDRIVIDDNGRMINIPRGRFEADGFWAPAHELWRRYYRAKPEPQT